MRSFKGGGEEDYFELTALRLDLKQANCQSDSLVETEDRDLTQKALHKIGSKQLARTNAQPYDNIRSKYPGKCRESSQTHAHTHCQAIVAAGFQEEASSQGDIPGHQGYSSLTSKTV